MQPHWGVMWTGLWRCAEVGGAKDAGVYRRGVGAIGVQKYAGRIVHLLPMLQAFPIATELFSSWYSMPVVITMAHRVPHVVCLFFSIKNTHTQQQQKAQQRTVKSTQEARRQVRYTYCPQRMLLNP